MALSALHGKRGKHAIRLNAWVRDIQKRQFGMEINQREACEGLEISVEE